MKKNNPPADKDIREVLEFFIHYAQKEIPLAEIEKYLLRPLGFDQIKPKKGSIYTTHHKLLEEMPGYAPTGNLTFHVVHGRKRVLIYKQNFRIFIAPTVKIIIDLLEEG